MPEKSLFEYAVIRVVPCVAREEFLNVGVILFCASKGYLQSIYNLNEDRLRAVCPEIDLEELQERLHVFDRICAGKKDGGTIGSFSISSRFGGELPTAAPLFKRHRCTRAFAQIQRKAGKTIRAISPVILP